MQHPDEKQFQTKLTKQEYLLLESKAKIRSEFVAGRIFAMTGASQRHNTIVVNIAAAFHSKLKGSPCRVFVNDLKVHVEKNDCFYYPDVMVVCEKLDGSAVYTSTPSLIVEVLSRSTWMIDKREKLLTYRTIDSLQEYLLVHQSKKMLELHRRNTKGEWETQQLTENSAEAAVTLQSVLPGEFQLSFDAIYDGVELSDQEKNKGHVKEETADYSCFADIEFCEPLENLEW